MGDTLESFFAFCKSIIVQKNLQFVYNDEIIPLYALNYKFSLQIFGNHKDYNGKVSTLLLNHVVIKKLNNSDKVFERNYKKLEKTFEEYDKYIQYLTYEYTISAFIQNTKNYPPNFNLNIFLHRGKQLTFIFNNQVHTIRDFYVLFASKLYNVEIFHKNILEVNHFLPLF